MTAVLRGLRAGIEAQIPGLTRAHEGAYDSNGRVFLEDPNAVYALSDTMMAYIHSPNLKKFVSVADALDEGEEEPSQLLDFIDGTTNMRWVWWVISSRPQSILSCR